MIDDNLNDVQQLTQSKGYQDAFREGMKAIEEKKMVKELKLIGINRMNCEIKQIEKDGSVDLEFKFYDRNDHGSFLYLDRNQAHLLMLYLQEYLQIKSGDGLKDLEQKGYWYCKVCRTLHKKDFICERLVNEQS